MKNAIALILFLALIGGLGFLGWKIFFPDEKAKIVEMLTALDAAADITPGGKPLSKLGAAGELTDFFTKDTKITVNRGPGRKLAIQGKDQLLQAAVGAQNMGAVISVTLKDPVIELGDSDNARVQLTAVANERAAGTPFVQMLDLTLVKSGGDWKISKATTVETFKRLE